MNADSTLILLPACPTNGVHLTPEWGKHVLKRLLEQLTSSLSPAETEPGGQQASEDANQKATAVLMLDVALANKVLIRWG